MPKITRIALVAVAALIGLVVLLVIVLKLITDETYERWMVAGVKSFTDRELSIAGDFSLDFGTTIRVDAHDVSIANTAWGTQPALFSADHLEAQVHLWPLLNGVVDIVLRAKTPKVMLETDNTGRGNWEMKPAAKEPEQKGNNGRGIDVLPRDIRFENATVSYLHGASGRTDELELNNFRVGLVNESLGMVLHGRYNGKPISLTADLGTIAALREGQSDVRADLQVGEVLLAADGSVADITNASGPTVDLASKLTAPSTAAFDAYTEATIPDLGALDVETQIKGGGGAYSAEDLRLKLAGERANANVQGRIGDLSQLRGFDLVTQITTTALPDVMQSLGVQSPVPLPRTLEAGGVVTGGLDAVAIKDLNARIEDKGLEATVTGTAEDILTKLTKASGPTVDLALNMKASSTAAFDPYTKVTVPDLGPLDLAAQIKGSGGAYSAEDLRIKLAGEGANANIKGTIGNLIHLKGFDLATQIATTTLPEVMQSLGVQSPVPLPRTLEASGVVTGGLDAVAVKDLNARIEDKGLEATVSGSVRNVVAAQGIDLALDANVQSLANLSELAGTKLPDTAAIQLQGHIAMGEGAEGPIEVSATVGGQPPQGDIAVTATITRLTEGIDLSATLKADSMADVGRLVGAQWRQDAPVKVSAQVTHTPGQLDAERIDILLGKSDLQGRLKFVRSEDDNPGKLEGNLQSELLDLNELLVSTTLGNAERKTKTLEGKTRVEPDKQTAAELITKVFSSKPLPFESLKRYQGNIQLVAQQIYVRTMQIEDADATVVLKDGTLELKLTEARVGDRPVDLALSLDAGRQPVTFDLHFVADRVPLSDVIAPDAPFQGGDVYVNLDGKGFGNSMSEIMGSVNGHLTFAIRGSRIPQSFFDRFGEGILSKINPLAKERGYSNLHCGAIHFDIKDGIAKTPRGLALQTNEVTWTGSGKIDLKTEDLDVRASSRARTGLGISMGGLAKIVRLGGTLHKPQLEPDPVGLASTSANVAFAISTGGIAILAKGLFDRVRSHEDLCKQIVQEIILPKDKEATN